MTLALTGPSVDGPLYRDVVDLARRSPGWLDGGVAAWSAYGLAVFALLMLVGWWRARRVGADRAMTALAVPVAVVVAFAADSGLKLLVREDRPCRNLPFRTLEACPAPGDYSFPSNHTAIAVAAAVALFFVSRRLGVLASVLAVAMGASRVWVGVHYPHDVLAGVLVGGLVAAAVMTALRRWGHGMPGRLTTTAGLRPLLTSRTPPVGAPDDGPRPEKGPRLDGRARPDGRARLEDVARLDTRARPGNGRRLDDRKRPEDGAHPEGGARPGGKV